MAQVCSRIARNTGIFSKLRYCMSLAQLNQLSYSLVNPCISYARFAWENGFLTQIKKAQTKQKSNKRNIFATTLGKGTESAFPFMSTLDILTVTFIFKFQTLKEHIVDIAKLQWLRLLLFIV